MMARLVMMLGLVLFTATAVRAQGDDIYLTSMETRNKERAQTREQDAAMFAALKKPAAEAPVTPELRKAVETVAKWNVYALTMSNIENEPADKPESLPKLITALESLIARMYRPSEAINTALQQVIHEQFMEALDKVVKNPQQRPIIRVNAARIMSRLASTAGIEEAADKLTSMIEDVSQVEGAKYYACQGLKGLLRKMAPKGQAFKDDQRRARVVTTLVTFIERAPPFTTTSPDQEEGIRFIRREAIRALSETRVAAIAGQEKGKAALCLCKVVGKDVSLVPEPRLDEQVEAAVGLGQLAPDPLKDFQPSAAAFYIGKFVVQFTLDYQERRPGRSEGEPWKVHAARMNDALAEMAKTHNDQGVISVQRLATEILLGIEQKQMRAPRVDNLLDHLGRLPEQQPRVHASDAKSVVTPRQPAKAPGK